MRIRVGRQISLEKHFGRVVAVMLAGYGALAGIIIARRWRQITGGEPEKIAQAVAGGHGYSLDGMRHWLFFQTHAEDFKPTAWADPLYTLLYAALIHLFGDTSRLIILLLGLACFLAAATLTTMVARKLGGAVAGLVALVFLLFNVRGTAITIGAWPMAALGVALLLFCLVHFIGDMTPRKAVLLGAALGACVLTWASLIVFLPVVIVLIFWFGSGAGPALRQGALVVATFLVLISPWTLRNYLVFDTFVLTRNGSGELVHLGTAGLGATMAQDSSGAVVPAPWASSGPFDAVARAARQDQIERRAIEIWQLQVLATQLGSELDGMKEAQRDKWLMREALDFVQAHPLLTIQLAAPKLKLLLGYGRLPTSVTSLVTAFAIVVCSVLAWRRRMLIVPLAMTLAYAAPFAVIVPYFLRYRFPIEPAVAVLVGVTGAWLVGLAVSRIGRLAPANPG